VENQRKDFSWRGGWFRILLGCVKFSGRLLKIIAMTKMYRQNPELDILFGLVDEIVPTKKEDFKPMLVTTLDENGVEYIFTKLYEKRPTTQSVLNFEQKIRAILSDSYYNERMIKRPKDIEVVLSISINKKRFYDVDVDNLAKTVLDSLVGSIIEDDSQVVNLVCSKHIHPKNTNGILIGITELTEERKGVLGSLNLFHEIH